MRKLTQDDIGRRVIAMEGVDSYKGEIIFIIAGRENLIVKTRISGILCEKLFHRWQCRFLKPKKKTRKVWEVWKTRSGELRIVTRICKDTYKPILTAISLHNGTYSTYDLNGFFYHDKDESPYDLVEKVGDISDVISKIIGENS